jgi:macrodomain Ter protein organizer (MatP/YcbG family)
MDHLNTNPTRTSLSEALEIAIENLENLKREGLITRYDQEPFEEEGIYHLTAYTKYPEKVDKELGHLSASISIEFDLPFYILVSRENEEG